MQYMLSVQMAAMVLNVEAGFVGPTSFVAGYGGTIDALVAAADAALADGSTATRSDMETLKNYPGRAEQQRPGGPRVAVRVQLLTGSPAHDRKNGAAPPGTAVHGGVRAG